ncbi:MAG TPA: PAS domain S-box protein [Aggregatilineales bacterium]|nr:PAS domain S-box protein [Aggregatilineales bacterium]
MAANIPLDVLILEDNPMDAELVIDELIQAGFDPHTKRVETEGDYLASLNSSLDLILADFSMPQFNANRALELLKERGLDIPFIVVSGSIGEEVAVAAMKAGASDYVLKDRLVRLGEAIKQVIRQRKLLEEKQQVENRFRTFVECLGEGLIITDLENRIEYVNPRMEELCGVRSEDIVGQPFFEVLLPAEDWSAATFQGKKLADGMAQHYEQRIKRKNGDLFWAAINASPLLDGNGQLIGVLRAVTDISEQKEAVKALLQSEIRFSQVFHSSLIGISITQLESGLILDANESYLRIIGYERSEVLGYTAQELDIWPTPLHQPETIDMLRSGGGIEAAERPFKTKSGELRDALISSQLIDLGREQGMLTFLLDITERKQAQADLLKAELLRVELDKEKELLHLKENFISIVSHEFRTPLTVILSATDIMHNYHERLSAEKRVKHLEEIQKEVQLMIDMLDDVLDYNRAQSGKIEFQPEMIDVEAFFRDLFEAVEGTDKGKHQFVFSNSNPLKQTNLDKRLLRHVLLNLLSNAVKYSPGGGEIRLELSGDTQIVVFRVTDQGMGIPDNEQDRLFQAFHRASNARSFQGTGLGLAIVKSNVEAHGGTIAFQSKLKVGTTFVVTIPIPL